MLKVEYRILSRPADVYWAGWKSDTLRLQQAGWEIAAEEDVMRDRIRLLMRHQNMSLWALTSHSEYRFQAEFLPGSGPPLQFQVVHVAPKIQVERIATVGLFGFEDFRQVDAQPQVVNSEIKSLEDFRIFATPLTRTEEIIVEPQTVQAMLDKIREMQAPEQVRLREKQRLAAARDARIAGELRPQQQFHAQIISIADRAAA